ncbi:TIGR03756 family integrating conjugative element protein [Marinobacter sp. SS8-8]|uniref:TIGR03756 family integrating conjugative element protein n=1 Tax=Marinobacter sp. SS8-8 TaxID=3050452 RepID=UPI0026DEE7D1|nr:TIGR03756 family integrating conjugative element protein [Marinobacter sp. SS8-8]
MNPYLKLLASVWLLLASGWAVGYPSDWTNYNPSSTDAVRDTTIGSTQQLLEQRGTVECIACHGETNDQYSGVINTIDITQQTMAAAMSCMDWELRGACVWMSCVVPPICTFTTSTKVKNFVPDLVVQSYDRANGEPWTESQDINQVSQGTSDSSWVTTMISWVENYNVTEVRGGQSNEAVKNDHVNLDFKLVDAYGNPALIAYNAMATGLFGMVCSGRSFPFFPYYISNLDSIAWRWNLPELFYPQSWAVGVPAYNLGTMTNNYGSIFPRMGFLTQADGLKSAVLTSFRAMHFITRTFEPHLYFSIGQPSEDGYWPAGPLDQNDKDTGVFQMLYPDNESSCAQFPMSAMPGPSKRSSDGSYVWNFWKAYKCCQRVGQTLVWHSG